MPVLIIIGFQYNHVDKLTSAITDMYIVYSFYRNLGFRIYLAMDNVKADLSVDFTRLIVDGIVDEGYEAFVRYISDIRHVIHSREDFYSFFDSIQLTMDRKVVLYYSGHGHVDGVNLPDSTILSNREILRTLLSLSTFAENDVSMSMAQGLNTSEANLFIIMDCCYSNGMLLPFQLLDGKYEDYTHAYVLPKIIFIASSNSIVSTVANSSESPFTRQLFNLLRNTQESVSLRNIVEKLSDHTSVYASYPTLYTLWGWAFCNVNVYERLNTLIVERK